MDRAEAKACAQAIRDHLDSARSMILDLYDREGWKALGYASWRECVIAEFETSKSHLYRQLDAAYIEREISPIGEIGSIPESHLRPLSGVPEGSRKAVWDKAVETAPDGKLTAKHVQVVVDEVAPSRPKKPRQPARLTPSALDAGAIDAGIESIVEDPPEEPRDIAAQRRAGIIPEGVVVDIFDPFGGEDEDEPSGILAEQNEAEFLNACPARDDLTDHCRAIFDRDALLYRQIEFHRQKFAHHARRALNATRKAGKTGNYHFFLSSFLRRDHPRHWLSCRNCNGTAQYELIGECPACHGTGYHS